MGHPDVQALAGRKGCSTTCAQGYVDGQRYRDRGERPPGQALFGIGEYCLGFRAGYLGVPLGEAAEPLNRPFSTQPLRWNDAEGQRATVATPSAVPQGRRFGGR